MGSSEETTVGLELKPLVFNSADWDLAQTQPCLYEHPSPFAFDPCGRVLAGQDLLTVYDVDHA